MRAATGAGNRQQRQAATRVFVSERYRGYSVSMDLRPISFYLFWAVAPGRRVLAPPERCESTGRVHCRLLQHLPGMSRGRGRRARLRRGSRAQNHPLRESLTINGRCISARAHRADGVRRYSWVFGIVCAGEQPSCARPRRAAKSQSASLAYPCSTNTSPCSGSAQLG